MHCQQEVKLTLWLDTMAPTLTPPMASLAYKPNSEWRRRTYLCERIILNIISCK